jgi:hypothetical protein
LPDGLNAGLARVLGASQAYFGINPGQQGVVVPGRPLTYWVHIRRVSAADGIIDMTHVWDPSWAIGEVYVVRSVDGLLKTDVERQGGVY